MRDKWRVISCNVINKSICKISETSLITFKYFPVVMKRNTCIFRITSNINYLKILDIKGNPYKEIINNANNRNMLFEIVFDTLDFGFDFSIAGNICQDKCVLMILGLFSLSTIPIVSWTKSIKNELIIKVSSMNHLKCYSN